MRFLNLLKKRFSFTGLVIGVVFLITLGLRINEWRHFFYFASDEGIQLITVSHLLKYGRLPISGEISGIDAESNLLIHNSPLGFYFQTLVYLAGLTTAEGYVLVYLILNLISLFLIYKITRLCFSNWSAIASLSFAGFSSKMIWLSTWPSQPVNAIFFNLIAAYLFVLAVFKKSEKMFFWSVVIAVLSLQFYPPMYLLLPVGIWIFYRYLRLLVRDKKIFLFRLGLAVIIIYLPLIIFEIISGWMNFQTVRGFIFGSANFVISDFSRNMMKNIKVLVGFHPLARMLGFKISLVLFIFWIGLFWVYQPNHRSKLGLILIWLTIPVPISSLMEKVHRDTYLFGLIPYVFILAGMVFEAFPKKLIPLSVLLAIVLLARNSFNDMRFKEGYNRLENIKTVVQKILADVKNRGLVPENYDLYVISSGDSWNWDAPPYWYFIESETGQRLVEIDPFESKIARQLKKKPKWIYLICQDIDIRKVKKDCLGIYLNREEGKIKIRNQWIFKRSNSLFVLERERVRKD